MLWINTNVCVFASSFIIKPYLLIYSVVQSPSWEANWFAASQIPRVSRNPKVHYRTHKRPPPVSILGQPYPVHIPAFHLLEIQPNIIHPSRPRSPQWSPSLRFPQQDPIHPLSSPIRATWPAHLILLDFILGKMRKIKETRPERQSPVQDLNPASPECKAGVLISLFTIIVNLLNT